MSTAVSILTVAAACMSLLVAAACVVPLVVLWRRRGLRKWIAAFDQGLEREERIRADFQRRHRFRL